MSRCNSSTNPALLRPAHGKAMRLTIQLPRPKGPSGTRPGPTKRRTPPQPPSRNTLRSIHVTGPRSSSFETFAASGVGGATRSPGPCTRILTFRADPSPFPRAVHMEFEACGDRHDVSDAEREILRSVLPRKHQGPRRVHDRRVMNGIFFVLRTGTPWRDLPERHGPCTTCFDRHSRWSGNGTWASIMEKLQGLAGDDGGDDDGPPGSVRLRMVDSSSVRVHRQGAGAPRDGAPPQVGLSRGARTTNVHLGLDGNEMVKTMFLTPGRAADCRQAEALLAGLGRDETVIGDRAYDTDAVLELIGEAGATAVMPSRSSRKSPRPLTARPAGNAISSRGSSAISRRSAGSPRATTRRPATSCPQCNWRSAVSCAGGSQTGYLSPRPRSHFRRPSLKTPPGQPF